MRQLISGAATGDKLSYRRHRVVHACVLSYAEVLYVPLHASAVGCCGSLLGACGVNRHEPLIVFVWQRQASQVRNIRGRQCLISVKQSFAPSELLRSIIPDLSSVVLFRSTFCVETRYLYPPTTTRIVGQLSLSDWDRSCAVTVQPCSR